MQWPGRRLRCRSGELRRDAGGLGVQRDRDIEIPAVAPAKRYDDGNPHLSTMLQHEHVPAGQALRRQGKPAEPVVQRLGPHDPLG